MNYKEKLKNVKYLICIHIFQADVFYFQLDNSSYSYIIVYLAQLQY